MGVEDGKLKSRYVRDTAGEWINPDTGEVSLRQDLKAEKYWDGPFAKVWKPATWMLGIETLPGFRMLGFILDQLPPNHCWLKVSLDLVVHLGFAPNRQQGHRGLKDLERAGVIVKRRQGEWWVNQKCVMNGAKYHKDNPANKKLKL